MDKNNKIESNKEIYHVDDKAYRKVEILDNNSEEINEDIDGNTCWKKL